jgi:outer membrane protein OmpA-like peptidoglycan-associated protein
MFEKSRSEEMVRLRAAGFSLAHAERLARNKRGPGLVIMGSSAAALLLLGGIVTLGFDMTRTVEAQVQTQAAVTQAQISDALAATTLLALQQNHLSQSLALEERAQAVEPEQTARAASGVTADIAQEPEPVVPETVVASGCVLDLSRLVQEVTLPFASASAQLPEAAKPVLGTLAAGLAECDAARLMISGYSDSTGPEVGNIQINWQRADATMSELVALGARPDQLEVMGFGTRVPASPDAPASAPENRRVDFRVLRRDEVEG